MRTNRLSDTPKRRALARLAALLTLTVPLVPVAGCDIEDHGSTAGEALGSLDQPVTGGICPGASTVQGIDVSVWQGAIDWTAVKRAGRAFGIARISDGVGYVDPTFLGNWNAMKTAGMIRGAYQYFQPSQDAIAQANLVVSRVGRLGNGDLPVMLDLEVTGGQSPATIAAKVHQWVDAVQRGTGKSPMIYTGAYFWDGFVGSHDFAGLPLVIAWYGTHCPGVPNAWRSWKFHQYSGSGSVAGVNGAVDLDVFNGSLAELQAFAAPAIGSDGCTAVERANAAKFGCFCVDHKGAGGFCPGSGCTALETANAAEFGCGCVDHHGNGGFCPGSGCTALETANAAKFGCGCVDHKGAGGFCPGTGCTAKETNDCHAAGRGCSLHKCVL